MKHICVHENVFNGRHKLTCDNDNLLTKNEVLTAVKSLSMKNCEGHDRSPQRFIIDGIDKHIGPILYLFEKIYQTNQIPQKWLLSKISKLPKNIPNGY